MKCENCGKEEATVHITEIDCGQSSEKNICDKCADILKDIDIPRDKGMRRLLLNYHSRNFYIDLKTADADQGYGLYCPFCNEELTKEQGK